MPSADAVGGAPSLQRDGDSLQIRGDLVAGAIAPLWKSALATLAGIRQIDVSRVGRVDSSGVALLGELAARAAAGVAIVGNPVGLDALRAAYRLTPALGYAD